MSTHDDPQLSLGELRVTPIPTPPRAPLSLLLLLHLATTVEPHGHGTSTQGRRGEELVVDLAGGGGGRARHTSATWTGSEVDDVYTLTRGAQISDLMTWQPYT